MSHTIELGEHASLCYYPVFITPNKATQLIDCWTSELAWVQSEISLFGKRVKIPRLNAWYGDKPYAYSGVHFEPLPFTTELADIKQRIEDISQLKFNSVLINWYRDGEDCMGWHSDNEASLGRHPQIASVSLGDCRKFVLREIQNKQHKKELKLESGSLLLMRGETQTLWQHSVPRTRKSSKTRINLTFRLIR